MSHKDRLHADLNCLTHVAVDTMQQQKDFYGDVKIFLDSIATDVRNLRELLERRLPRP